MSNTGRFGKKAKAGRASKTQKAQPIYNPRVGFAYDPSSDVPSTPAAQKGAADYVKRKQERLFPSAKPGEDVYDSYQGPGFGPGGDVYLSPQEIKNKLKYGQYFPDGALARGPDGRPMPFDFTEGADVPGMGRGGRGGRGSAIPTFAEVQDSIVQFYEGLVGTTPTGEVQDWLYQKVAGGQSWQQMEQDIEGAANYRERYPGIENHPEWTGPDYDKFMQSFDAMSLENLGRVLSAGERSELLGIKTDEDEEKWLNKMVGASLPSGMDILGDDLGERGNSSG